MPTPSNLSGWQRVLIGVPGVLIAAVWGFAEATLFFVIPDVFLSFVALLHWPSTWKHVLSAIAGATLGGALLFQWAAADHAGARAAIDRVPFIRESMFAKVDAGLQSQGLSALLWGSLGGLPYKLYAVEAPRFAPETNFLLATPPARAVRFLVVWCAFGMIAARLRRRFTLRTVHLLLIYSLVWIAVYALYWGRIFYG